MSEKIMKTLNGYTVYDESARKEIETLKNSGGTSASVEQTDNGAIITVTDKDGETTTAEILHGQDGVSPEITLAEYMPTLGADNAGGVEITVTNADGTTSTKRVKNGLDGLNGADGTSVTISDIKRVVGTDGGGYTEITFSDGSTITISDGTNGADGQDGRPGADGTSVVVASVSESAEDGGNNVVTFSDGKTLTVKNGKTGAAGAAGANGKDGSDANVTSENIESALGYTPADAETVNELSNKIADFDEALNGSGEVVQTPMTANDFEMGGIYSGTNPGNVPGSDTIAGNASNTIRCRTGLVPCTNELPISVEVKSGGKWKAHYFNGNTWIGEVNGMITESSDNIVSLYTGDGEVTNVRILLGLTSNAETTVDELLSYFTLTRYKESEPIIATREWVLSTIGLIANAEDGEW